MAALGLGGIGAALGSLGFVDVFGLFAGSLGIIQFSLIHFPTPNYVDAVVRVAVGLDVAGGLDNAGGDLPDVRLYNEAGEFLGLTKDPGGIGDGGFADITIHQEDKSTQQATYTLFSANKNAICIAYTTITLPSQDRYSWIGDWGHQCGASWYYSHIYISGTDVQPDCMWIDSNNDQPQTGFQIHWPEFYVQSGEGVPEDPAAQQEKIDYFCSQQPAFKYYNFETDKDPRSITVWPITNPRDLGEEGEGEQHQQQKREPIKVFGPPKHADSPKFWRGGTWKPRHKHNNGNETANPHLNRLVISNSTKHTTEGLCESESSYGPDFVNTATGMFCRMSDKTQFPVCSATDDDNCFNTDLQQLIINGVSARDTPYMNVVDWTQ